ncbi:MAG: aminotransferase class IV, partial [Phycisphaerae bacterium]
ILEGITRGLVMELARKRGFEVTEEMLVTHDLYIADEIFGTGTAAEIVPIVSVNKRTVGHGKPGPITKQLTDDFIAYRNG